MLIAEWLMLRPTGPVEKYDLPKERIVGSLGYILSAKETRELAHLSCTSFEIGHYKVYERKVNLHEVTCEEREGTLEFPNKIDVRPIPLVEAKEKHF